MATVENWLLHSQIISGTFTEVTLEVRSSKCYLSFMTEDQSRSPKATEFEHGGVFWKVSDFSTLETPVLRFYYRILGDAVGVKAGERWRIIRKYFDPEFTPAISIKAISNFSAKIGEWVDTLPTQAGKVPSTDGSFMLDVKGPCRFLPFQLVALQLYGDVFSDEVCSPFCNRTCIS